MSNRVRRAFQLFGDYLLIVAAGVLLIIPLTGWLVLEAGDILSGMSRALDYYGPLLRRTGLHSVVAAIASTLGGVLAGMAFVLSGRRGRAAIGLALALPMMMGFVARNYAWLGLLEFLSSLPGWLGSAAGWLLYGEPGVMLVLTVVFLPFSFAIVLPGCMAVRRPFVEAAATLGATPLRGLVGVLSTTLLVPGLLSVSLVFALSAGYFLTPSMIGGGNADFLANAVLTLRDQVGDRGAGAALALLLLATTTPVAVCAAWLAQRERDRDAG